MLSEEEKNQIRLEEKTQSRERLSLEQQRQKALATEHYRQEVRGKLHRDSRNYWLLLIPILLVAVAFIFQSMFLPVKPIQPEDTTGGIADSEFIKRCESEVIGQMGGELEISQEYQVFSNVEGKQLNGWVAPIGNEGKPFEFSCSYTAISDSLKVEIIR